MKLNELFTDDRAVSPVVGVALLIAITVILAAVIGGVVLGLGTGGVDTPQAQIQAQFTDGDVTIEHNGGEPLSDGEVVIVLENYDSTEEDTVDLSDSDDIAVGGELTAGGSVTFQDGAGDLTAEGIDAVTILWEDPNSDSTTVLEQFEA